jgi:beta-glucanase (GH16 family)
MLRVEIKRLVSMISLGLWVSLAAGADAKPEWISVWSDEFSQANGTAPDPAKWVHDLGGGGWGNNELQTYTSRTNNCRVENGHLIIEARKEQSTGTDGISREYTSARLKTKDKAAWTCGRIEARLQVSRGQGLWPAFWMLGANIDSVGWPACGEIDILENIGTEPSIIHGTIHGPGYAGGGGIGASHKLAGNAAFADDSHVFAVEWESNRIHWYVDGRRYFTATPASLPSGKQWVFDKLQFLLLNLAVGGHWPGNPNATTTFPQRLTVDYVRVFAASNAPALADPGSKVSGSTK